MFSCFYASWQRCPLVSAVDHLPDKETRKRKPKKAFEIDFEEDVNFDTYFRTTRVSEGAFSGRSFMQEVLRLCVAQPCCCAAVVVPGGHHQQQVGPQRLQQEDHPAGRLPVPPGDAVPAQPQAVRLRECPARHRPLLAACVPLLLHWCAALTPLLSDVQLRQEAQKRLSGEMGEGIGDYDYNNANDTANFCPALEVTPPGCSPVGF